MTAQASLTKRTVLEQLSNMAREVAYASGRVSKALMEGKVDEAHEAAREAEESVDVIYYRLLDYIANGRSELLDNADLYLFIARSIHRAAQRLEAALFRLSVLNGEKLPEEALKRAGWLAVKAKEAAGLLDSALTLVASAMPESMVLVKSRLKQVARLEEEADSEYRSMLTWLLGASGMPAAQMLLLKDAVDFIESVVDELYEAANHLRIIAETS